MPVIRTWEYETKIRDYIGLADWLNGKDAEGWEYVSSFYTGVFCYHTFRRPYRTPIAGHPACEAATRAAARGVNR